MFDHFDVTSLSAFRTKFSMYRLDPSDKHPISKATKTGMQWGSSHDGPKSFYGCMLGSRFHGQGVLLQTAKSAQTVYIGHFEAGLRNGHGVVLTSRGETFHGYFKDDLMWGPGTYTFPWPAPKDGNIVQLPRHRVRFDGMFNGRPAGKGRLVWSDGAVELGEFDGMHLVQPLAADDCSGVLLVAESNAEMAKRSMAEVEAELRSRGLWEDQAAASLAAATDRSQTKGQG